MNQITFDPLDYPSDGKEGQAAKIAKAERDAEYFRLRKLGKNVSRFVLRGQLRQYAGFGRPDGRVRDVYFLQINR